MILFNFGAPFIFGSREKIEALAGEKIREEHDVRFRVRPDADFEFQLECGLTGMYAALDKVIGLGPWPRRWGDDRFRVKGEMLLFHFEDCKTWTGVRQDILETEVLKRLVFGFSGVLPDAISTHTHNYVYLLEMERSPHTALRRTPSKIIKIGGGNGYYWRPNIEPQLTRTIFAS